MKPNPTVSARFLNRLLNPRCPLRREVSLLLSLACIGVTVCAQTLPALTASSPWDGANSVRVSSRVVFKFNQAMKKTRGLGGNPPTVPGAIAWSGTGLDPAKFSYSWSSNGRELSCVYDGDLPGRSTIGWQLNPRGAGVLLESTANGPLPPAVYEGRFTTGVPFTECDPDGIPAGWGIYRVFKTPMAEQHSQADPTYSESGLPFLFGVVITSPQVGPKVIEGSITERNGERHNLIVLPGGTAQFYEAPADEAALDASFPATRYTLRFTLEGQTQQAITMNLPELTSPIPKVLNYTEAQAIDSTSDFTLHWNPDLAAGADAYISLTINDEFGALVLEAPDVCTGRELTPTADSFVLPAGSLGAGAAYTATLAFGQVFYTATNRVPMMAGSGVGGRSTQFTIRTTPAVVTPALPPILSDYRWLPNGHPEFKLRGSPQRLYTLQRVDRLDAPTWPDVTVVKTDANGEAVYEELNENLVAPLYYRAYAN